RRAQALGLLERPLPFRGAVALDEAIDLLEGARAVAGSRGAGVERLVGGWHDRFMREYGGLASRDPEGWRLLGLRAGMEGRAGGGGGGARRRLARPVQAGVWRAGEPRSGGVAAARAARGNGGARGGRGGGAGFWRGPALANGRARARRRCRARGRLRGHRFVG